MIPTREELIGTWISKDFPNYHYKDGIEFTFHFGKYATFYLSNDNNRVITEGTYEIKDMDNGNFNIVVDGLHLELQKSILNLKLYIKKEPKCFVMLTPNNGWRYFEKLKQEI